MKKFFYIFLSLYLLLIFNVFAQAVPKKNPVIQKKLNELINEGYHEKNNIMAEENDKKERKEKGTDDSSIRNKKIKNKEDIEDTEVGTLATGLLIPELEIVKRINGSVYGRYVKKTYKSYFDSATGGVYYLYTFLENTDMIVNKKDDGMHEMFLSINVLEINQESIRNYYRLGLEYLFYVFRLPEKEHEKFLTEMGYFQKSIGDYETKVYESGDCHFESYMAQNGNLVLKVVHKDTIKRGEGSEIGNSEISGIF